MTGRFRFGSPMTFFRWKKTVEITWFSGQHPMILHLKVSNPWGGPPVLIIHFRCGFSITLWLFNIAMGNGPFIDGLPIKNGDFPWLC